MVPLLVSSDFMCAALDEQSNWIGCFLYLQVWQNHLSIMVPQYEWAHSGGNVSFPSPPFFNHESIGEVALIISLLFQS